jgi:hypothetical protein
VFVANLAALYITVRKGIKPSHLHQQFLASVVVNNTNLLSGSLAFVVLLSHLITFTFTFFILFFTIIIF